MHGGDSPWPRTLRERPALLRAAAEFLAGPARYVHPARLPALGFDGPALFAALAATPRGERRLSTLLARRAALPDGVGAAFAEERFRLAWLPFATLERLFALVAAATLRSELARIVERASRQRVEAVLGGEALAFALKEAPALPQPWCRDWWAAEGASDDLPARCRRNRVRALEDALAGAPAAVAARLRLKLPPDWDADFALPAPAERIEAVWSLARRLLRAKFPDGGGPCFA